MWYDFQYIENNGKNPKEQTNKQTNRTPNEQISKDEYKTT